MQDSGKLAATIQAYVSEEFVLSPDQTFDYDTNLIEAGIIDSFGLVQMIVFVESKLGVKFSEDDLVSPEMTSINGIVRLLASKS